MSFFKCGIYLFIKYIYSFLTKRKTLLRLDFPYLKFIWCYFIKLKSYPILKILNPIIEHLDIFWNILNLILVHEPGKNALYFLDDSKSGNFIIGQSEQQLNTNSYFGIFDSVIGEGQWYCDT